MAGRVHFKIFRYSLFVCILQHKCVCVGGGGGLMRKYDVAQWNLTVPNRALES